jgi:hypothetical protein
LFSKDDCVVLISTDFPLSFVLAPSLCDSITLLFS